MPRAQRTAPPTPGATRNLQTFDHGAQIRADPGDSPSPDAGDSAGHKWFRYSAGGAQLGLMDGRWPDSAKFEQFEPERFYLRQDSVHRGAILKPAGEHGLAAPHLRPHGRKRGQSGSSEPPPDPDHVLAAGLRGHAVILGPDRVSGRHRNPVVVRAPIWFQQQRGRPRLRQRRRSDRPEPGARGQRAPVLRRVRTPGATLRPRAADVLPPRPGRERVPDG